MRLARRTDPPSSRGAIRDLFESGAKGRQQQAAEQLVRDNPGMSFQRLFAIHIRDCNQAGRDQVFKDATALMRRLNEVAMRGESKYCLICDRKVLTWWPK